MNNIQFFILVPTKESIKDLGRLISSFKLQNYLNWKVLFIDGSELISSKNFIKKVCSEDSRFQYIEEEGTNKSIYNAMNLGFNLCKANSWILFLGSDDWLSSPFSLNILEKNIKSNQRKCKDSIYLCKTRYFKRFSLEIRRENNIPKYKFLDKKLFNRVLYFGFSPVHQSACFSHAVLKKLMPYNLKYALAADLDLFFRIKYLKRFKIFLIDEFLVNLSEGGESSKRTSQRIIETLKIYKKNFKFNFMIPFLFRYMQKIFFLKI